MQGQLDPLSVPEEAYQLGVNVAIDQQALSQRDGYREVPLRSTTDGLVAEFQALNLQGAVRYQPGHGQSALQFASKADYLALSAGGRRFLVEIVGRGGNMYGNLVEITNGVFQAPDLHQNWALQAENYLINCDDFGNTVIFDGTETTTESAGFDPNNPVTSKIPNRVRLPVYTHGRIAVVNGARGMLVGDIIHGQGKSDASNLLNFSEQIYWAEGYEFVVPTDAGTILAVYNLPTVGQSSSHGELVVETEERVYAYKTQLYPRTSWIDTPNMMTTVSAEGGARGPWSFDVYTDNAVRRTLRGIETLTFSRRGSDLVYEPQELLSEPIDLFLEEDYGPLLRFNSTRVHRSSKTLYSTVRPWVSGFHWKHRGVVAYDYKGKRWNGVNVNPSPIKDVKALIPMSMSGEKRFFQIAGNDDDGTHIKILEVERNLREDVLTDGTYPIQSAVYTRAVYGSLEDSITVNDGTMQFARVSGDVEWEVLWKSDWSQGCWTEWASGKICHEEVSATGVKSVNLGKFNGKEVDGIPIRSGKHFEFLIRWKGKADLRFHTVDVSRREQEDPDIFDEEECSIDRICCENADPLTLWQ
jgi:hypothetical protein